MYVISTLATPGLLHCWRHLNIAMLMVVTAIVHAAW